MNAIRTTQRSSTESISIFPPLPVEIVRVILEVSARDSGQAAAGLLRVSSFVRSWILPILYETIVIENPRECLQILSNLSKYELRADSTRVLNSLVRNICLSVPRTVVERDWIYGTPVLNEVATGIPMPLMGGANVLWTLLHTCTNVQNLYINIATLDHFELSNRGCRFLSHLTDLHCGSDWDAWLYFSNNLHIFSTLTHLRVDIVYNSGLSRSWTPLRAPSNYLPNLTHLAFSVDSRCKAPELRGAAVFVGDILARSGMVMVILTAWFSWSRKRFLEVFSHLDDPRLSIIHIPGPFNEESSVAEWQAQARGQRSIWEVPVGH